jgi:ABC-type branched-subunit amino acid transport system permease subunit
VISLPVSVLVLRLSGGYFAVATLGWSLLPVGYRVRPPRG